MCTILKRGVLEQFSTDIWLLGNPQYPIWYTSGNNNVSNDCFLYIAKT
jgi:hypothetical protein